MKRKLYLDIAIFIVILAGFGAFIFIQQQAPATEAQTQEAADAPAAGCCGAATVEGETSPETAGGCCGTPETAQSEEVEQQVQTNGTPETDETSPKTPPSEDADEGGCGCGS